MSDFDAEAAAARASGSTPENGESAGTEAPAGGSDGSEPRGEPSGSGADSLVGRLLDSEAEGPDVSQVRREYDVPRPLAFILRGVIRTASGSALPPLGDMTLGGLLYAATQGAFGTAEGDDDQDDDGDQVGGGLDGDRSLDQLPNGPPEAQG